MKVLDLFCGTKSFASVADEMGFETITLDFDPQFKPDICINLMKTNCLPEVDIIWASPPCEHFSVSSIGVHWNKDHTPKTENAKLSLSLSWSIRWI